MITALDHIAVAVPDLQKAIERFVEDFGLPLGGTEDVEAAKTTAAFPRKNIFMPSFTSFFQVPVFTFSFKSPLS